jgi:hypothetical protein
MDLRKGYLKVRWNSIEYSPAPYEIDLLVSISQSDYFPLSGDGRHGTEIILIQRNPFLNGVKSVFLI